MDGGTNGSQEATQSAQDQTQQQGQEQQETQQGQQEVNGGNSPDYEKQIAERDEKIASLEAAEQLRGEIAELKAQGESDRIDFKLQLAGVRNVKAARALLGDHDNDVDKLKEAEPWLFGAIGKHAKGGAGGGSGTTGLPNAGAASDDGKTLKHWREKIALTNSLSSMRATAKLFLPASLSDALTE